MHIVCDTVAPLPRPARHMNARPCDVSRSRGRLLKSIPRSENTTGAHRALLPRRLSNFRATTRHKSRGLETPWDHKTRRSSGTKIGPSLEYKSQPCQGMDMMQLIGCWYRGWHYNDVIMGAMVSQITNLTIVHSTADSGAGQRKPQKLRLTGLCEGSSPVTGESPHKGPANTENVSVHLVMSSCGRHSICVTVTSYISIIAFDISATQPSVYTKVCGD